MFIKYLIDFLYILKNCMNLVKWIYYKTYMYVTWCVYSFIVNILYTGLFSKCIWYWPQWLKIIIFRYMLLYIHAYSPIVTHLSILLPRFGYNAEKMEIKTQRLDQMSIRFRSLFSNPILLQKCHTCILYIREFICKYQYTWYTPFNFHACPKVKW